MHSPHHNPITLATYEHWNSLHPILHWGPDRTRHLFVIDQTGTVKSTLLKSIIAQDIVAGAGVAFLDPHGDPAEELLELIPSHRTDDLVYFAPGDLEHPVSFNLLANIDPQRRSLVVSAVVSAFKSIWRDSSGAAP